MTRRKRRCDQIFVVLATFNGASYVAQQIESIISQTESNWRLLVRDDGSNDETLEVVADCCRADARIKLLKDAHGRRGPAGNFGVLMQAALDRGADYLFFADQDDVWHPHKIEEQLILMRQTERDTNIETPTLVYTDLAATNQRLDVIQPSYNESTKPPAPEGLPFLIGLLHRNFVPGCTILANRALLQLSLPLPAAGMMHDYWLALCAAACGNVRCVPRVMLQYRRHSNNVTPTAFAETFRNRLLRLARRDHLSTLAMHNLSAQVESARTLLRRMPPRKNCPRRSALVDYVQAFEPDMSASQRIGRLRQLGVPYRCGPASQVTFYLRAIRLDHFIRKAG